MLRHAASMRHRRDTSFFYSLAELSKSRIFPSPFSSAFTQVIGHFAANFGQLGCLLPWPDPCCCCNGDSISTSSPGAFSTPRPPSLLGRRAPLNAEMERRRRRKKRELKSDFEVSPWCLSLCTGLIRRVNRDYLCLQKRILLLGL